MKEKVLKAAVPLLVLLWGLYMIPLRSSGLDFSRIPGDLGDARFNNYILEHGYRYLAGIEPDFWSAPFFYPELNTVAFSDNHIGNIPLYGAFRLAGLSREGAFQGWIVCAFVLNFAVSFYVLRKMSFSVPACSAGAYLFSFGLPVAAQINHIQLIPRYFVPAVFYCLWNYARNPLPRHIMLVSLFTALQFFLSVYTGWFLVLSGTVFFIVSFRVMERSGCPARKRIFHMACALILAAVLLVPLALPYARVIGETEARPWSEIYSMLPRTSSFVFPAGGSLLWRWLGEERAFEYPNEHRIFPGGIPFLAVPVMLVLYFLKRGKDEREKLAFAGAASIVLVFFITGRMSAGGVNLYRLLTSIPGVGAIRAVTRVILVLLFLFSIPVAFFWDKTAKAVRGKFGKAGIFLAPLLILPVVADQGISPFFSAFSGEWNSYCKRNSVDRAEAVRRKLLSRSGEPGVFVYMPGVGDCEPFWQVHLDAMFASQDSGVPTVNGYSGFFPDYYDLSMNFRDFWALDRWMAYSNRKWERISGGHPRVSSGDLFEGLVILGSPRGQRGKVSFMEGPLPPDEFKAGIYSEHSKISGAPGDSAVFDVTVANRSNVRWSAAGKPDGTYEFSLRWRRFPEDGEKAGSFNRIKNIRYDLPPGESRDMRVEIPLPESGGIFIYEFDVFQNGVSRFGEKSAETLKIPVEVVRGEKGGPAF